MKPSAGRAKPESARLFYAVAVKPHSKKGPCVLATGDHELTVYLREKPVAGEANQALIKVLAEYFGVAKTCIRLKSGARGRQKLVEVDN